MENREFGRQVQNIPKPEKQNHVIFKSKSFSFQNNQKKEIPDSHIHRGLIRRNFVTGLIKKNNLSNANILSIQADSKIIEEKIDLETKLKLIDDPQMLSSYLTENLESMRNQEENHFKLRKQKRQVICQFTEKRMMIVDWLAALHYELQLFPETLFMAVYYFDLFLAADGVLETELEKAALSCLFVAAKFEQTYRIPYIRNLLELTTLSITKQQIKTMEQRIIKVMDFQLIVQIPLKYFFAYSKLVQMSEKNKYIGMYILELSLLDPEFFEFSPSLMGAAGLYLVHKIRKISPVWPLYLQELTGYTESELRHCAKFLCSLLEKPANTSKGQKIRRKYSTSQFLEASKIKLQRKVSN